MPRNAKRQAPAAPTGQDYGDRQEQIQAQNAMPLPDVHGAPPGGGPTPASPGGGAAPTAPDPMAAALAMEPPTPPPWAEGVPDEQVTAGLMSGPGPGPEALPAMNRPRAPISQMLRLMADATGDPYLAEQAQIAESHGA